MPSIVSVMEIEKSIKNYQLISKELQRLQNQLPVAETKPTSLIESEAVRRGLSRLSYLQGSVRFVEERIELITDERERTLLDCMIDGMTLEAIGEHLGRSRPQVHRIKENVLKRLYDSQFGDTLKIGVTHSKQTVSRDQSTSEALCIKGFQDNESYKTVTR